VRDGLCAIVEGGPWTCNSGCKKEICMTLDVPQPSLQARLHACPASMVPVVAGMLLVTVPPNVSL
jgi:hypothetical protein